ncbi:MAG: hypothetical protein AAGC64_00680 [Bacteroidota bacterium]
MTQTIEHIEVLKELQKEILLNPEMRHRIILKAIKTTESRNELDRVVDPLTRYIKE